MAHSQWAFLLLCLFLLLCAYVHQFAFHGDFIIPIFINRGSEERKAVGVALAQGLTTDLCLVLQLHVTKLLVWPDF